MFPLQTWAPHAPSPENMWIVLFKQGGGDRLILSCSARPPLREVNPHPVGSRQRLACATSTRRRAGVVAGGGGSHTPGTASSVWHSLPSPHPSFPLNPYGPVSRRRRLVVSCRVRCVRACVAGSCCVAACSGPAQAEMELCQLGGYGLKRALIIRPPLPTSISLPQKRVAWFQLPDRLYL